MFSETNRRRFGLFYTIYDFSGYSGIDKTKVPEAKHFGLPFAPVIKK
jgi:hypothetical protein